ncbi:hypothetical protein L573_0406 [Bordetella holmesii H620]|nr:hypothetical protein L573_0406 [Bordetella holmesii H620]KCV02413.1 hypothetical protein L498_0410 [Bordetella holmesii CDC-H629-BH]
MKNQGSSVTAIKHGSTLFRDEPFFCPKSAAAHVTFAPRVC